jgi:hypothetical protein
MKPSELDRERMAERLLRALQLYGVSDEDAVVLQREDHGAFDPAFDLFLATPVGLVVARDEQVSGYERRRKVGAELVPWSDVKVEVQSAVYEMPDQPLYIEAKVTLAVTGRDAWSFAGNSEREAKERTGLFDFTAAVLRWIAPLRM